jgi:hypothetical protein
VEVAHQGAVGALSLISATVAMIEQVAHGARSPRSLSCYVRTASRYVLLMACRAERVAR